VHELHLTSHRLLSRRRSEREQPARAKIEAVLMAKGIPIAQGGTEWTAADWRNVLQRLDAIA
jgi:hypothetical protein